MPERPRDGGWYPEKCRPNRRYRPLNEDQRELAAQYLPLARAIARQMRTRVLEHDDLESAACLALVEAARTFDPSRKVRFPTYARHRIRGALLDYRNTQFGSDGSEDRFEARVVQPIASVDESRGHVIGVRPSPPAGTELESIEDLEAWLRQLPPAHAKACRMIYLDGWTQDETAALLGCSKSYLSRLHRDAIGWLSRGQPLTTCGRTRGRPNVAI